MLYIVNLNVKRIAALLFIACSSLIWEHFPQLWHAIVHGGQRRHFSELSHWFQESFGPNHIFLPCSVPKLCCLFSYVFLYFFTPYFCLYLNFTFCWLWPPWTISCHNGEYKPVMQTTWWSSDTRVLLYMWLTQQSDHMALIRNSRLLQCLDFDWNKGMTDWNKQIYINI